MAPPRPKKTVSRAKKTVSRPKKTVSRAKKTVSKPRPKRTPVGRPHVLDVPFAHRSLATAHGARWQAEEGVFVYRGEQLPPALRAYRATAYSWESAVQLALDGSQVAPAPAAHAAFVPRPHQQVAIEAITKAARARRAGFLLADDVGLGKTLSTWEAIRQMTNVKTVLIVCPLAVVPHWRRTLAAQGDDGRRIVVMNYERLGKLFEVSAAARKKVRSKKGLARAGTAPTFDVIVWDESHRCKNPVAARSKFAAKLNAKAGFVLWLSATAGQNPLELSYLAPLLSEQTGAKVSDLKAFETWCASQGLGVTRGAFGRWDWRGEPADCEKVRTLLFDGEAPAGLRRRPEDLEGWPELNRILTPLGLDAEARELYEQAWSEFRAELDLEPSGRDPKNALVAALRLRQKSSLIRVQSTVDLAVELLGNGHHVAISVAFVETLYALQEALASKKIEASLVFGGLAGDAREQERMRFQTGKVPVVIFTVEEGISLHQGEHDETPRSMIIHDLRWSAIQMAQVEGRCHRDGRYAPVYWAYADDTIEERIAGVVCRRIETMKAMVGDDVETLQEIARLVSES